MNNVTYNSVKDTWNVPNTHPRAEAVQRQMLFMLFLEQRSTTATNDTDNITTEFSDWYLRYKASAEAILAL
jgi:hypothetical protein